MTSLNLHRLSALVLWTVVGVCSSVTPADAQTDFRTSSQADALSAAVSANPKLAKDMAKELGSTPEEAAGTAGALFGIAKALLKPEEFEKVAKAVPGMDALLAVVPQDAAMPPAAPALMPTPGFASSTTPSSSAASPSSVPVTMAAPNGITSAIAVLSKMGISPAMLGKAIPFLTGYLKKSGGKDVGGLLGQVFKTGKP